MKVAGTVAAFVSSDEASGTVSLSFAFEDATDRSLKARVGVQMEPAEAVDLVDKLLGELQRLGVSLKVAS